MPMSSQVGRMMTGDAIANEQGSVRDSDSNQLPVFNNIAQTGISQPLGSQSDAQSVPQSQTLAVHSGAATNIYSKLRISN